MNNNPQVLSNHKMMAMKIISWEFGIGVLAAGVVNTFWGNDPYFGIFIMLLSLVYFLPVNDIAKQIAGISIPRLGLIRIILGVFIIWALVGVGELFDKMEMARIDILGR